MYKPITPLKNHLLAALPMAVQDRLMPHLELVTLPLGRVLYESGDLLQHVFFPVDAVISLLYVTEGGALKKNSIARRSCCS